MTPDDRPFIVEQITSVKTEVAKVDARVAGLEASIEKQAIAIAEDFDDMRTRFDALGRQVTELHDEVKSDNAFWIRKLRVQMDEVQQHLGMVDKVKAGGE
jgi:hypothetical protein